MTQPIIHADPEWQRRLPKNWLDTIMTVSVTDRFHAKQGRSIGRWTIPADDGTSLVVYLKRHFQLPFWRGFMARLWPWRAWSPGLEEWQHLQTAKSLSISVPKALAAGELRGPGSRLQSFLAIEELHGKLALHEAIPIAYERLSDTEFHDWKRGLIREMARLCQILHTSHYFHRDLYLCHFYIHENFTTQVPTSWKNQVDMIDFHRLTYQPWNHYWFQLKDLSQLLFSADVPGITSKDALRFWKYYRNENPKNAKKWLRPLIRWKGGRYTRHNEKRSQLSTVNV